LTAEPHWGTHAEWCAAPISVIEFAGYRRLLSRDEQDAVVDLVAYEPTCGDLIPGTGGLRKVRVGREHSGKRGGARVVYYFHDTSIPIHLLAIYAKNEKSDLSAAEKKEFAALIKEIVARWQRR
jgi:mRNA-degrading endonuclease RelE of RelBE toxin-antitoxin system